MKPYHFRKYFNIIDFSIPEFILMYATPLAYFSVITLGIYQLFGLNNIHIYISTLFLINALFWGFLDENRAIISFVLLILVLINFLINGTFTALLFIVLSLVFLNTRDLGAFMIIVLILFNIYSLINPKHMITNVPRVERIKDLSNFLTGYPEYNLTITKEKMFWHVAVPKYEFETMKKHYIKSKRTGDGFTDIEYEWVGTHSPSKKELDYMHGETELIKKYMKIVEINYYEEHPEEMEKKLKAKKIKDEKINNDLIREILGYKSCKSTANLT